ncbi:MAG: rod shape-determining protein MreC [Candidatus Omnitrophica bacterium]|nr:rod shape-determining protein MreC [Candidatus Omnitrophota bacterium]
MQFYRIRKFPTKLTIVFIICLVFFLNPDLRLWLKKFTFHVAYIPARAFQNIKNSFAKTERLNEENLDLKRRVGELSVELSRMKQKKEQIERLEELLGFKLSLRYEAKASRVIARDIAGFRKFFVIDKGSRDGINENTPCVSLEGIVGNVVAVSPNTSKVMLITDPASRIGVTVTSSCETGLMLGSVEGQCRVIYLGLDGDIKEGDEVVTSGTSSLFPEGLPVGTIKHVGIERTKLYRYAEIIPYAEMSKIREVLAMNTGER